MKKSFIVCAVCILSAASLICTPAYAGKGEHHNKHRGSYEHHERYEHSLLGKASRHFHLTNEQQHRAKHICDRYERELDSLRHGGHPPGQSGFHSALGSVSPEHEKHHKRDDRHHHEMEKKFKALEHNFKSELSHILNHEQRKRLDSFSLRS